MISKIKSFFNTHMIVTDKDTASNNQARLHTAAAALLVEIMVTDGLISEHEERTINKLLINNFSLSASEAEQLFELARQEATEATSLYQFTTLINEHFSEAEKFSLLTQAWQVALSDDNLDKYEENLIRRLADLLYIRHGQFIKAKSLAQEASLNDKQSN